jgi:uncharacterized protein (TIGR00661 family)
VYGLRRDLKEDLVEQNLTYRPFSESTFIDDLRTCRAVIAGGGYTLMSEAVYLHKLMLSTPLEGQFEQTLNALYLEKLEYGMHAPRLTAEKVAEFLGLLPRLEESLQSYRQDGNQLMLAALKDRLAQAMERKGSW